MTWVERLTAAARAGEPLDLADGTSDPDLRDPAKADRWPEERWIPADAIRATLLRSDLNPDPFGLRITGARITGKLHLEHAKIACPFVLVGSRLDDDANLNYAQLPELWLSFTHTCALNLDGLVVKGDVHLMGLTATGEVRAIGAHITGPLDLILATLTNKDGIALHIDLAQLEGGAMLRGLTATGVVRAIGARITGPLLLEGANLTNKDGIALGMDGAQLEGGASLNGLTATGEVRAPGARIGGQLTLNLARLINTGQGALSLDGARVDELWLPEIGAIDGEVSLTAAQIGDLIVNDTEPQGGLPSPLLAAGWQIGDVHGIIRTDRRVAARWLDTRPTKDGFVAQPWHELAAVYDRNGQPADARWMRYQSAVRSTKSTKRWRWSWLGRQTYRWTTGHGYYPLAAAGWLVVIFVLAWSLTAAWADEFTTTTTDTISADLIARAEAAATSGEAEDPPIPEPLPSRVPAEWCTEGWDVPCLNPPVYALTTAFPAAAATQVWTPPDGWSTVVFYILRLLAWAFTAILLAGVTGLLRKQT